MCLSRMGLRLLVTWADWRGAEGDHDPTVGWGTGSGVPSGRTSRFLHEALCLDPRGGDSGAHGESQGAGSSPCLLHG